ncbi:hypothetical protein GQ44DRAFT_634909 [Phaeosphaeriaceae sp. PMI808]|nr:hypothetical protein GQ44DRAFT_634909 [Phaeosphaeriaceae sp. PMI808]
MADRRVFSFQSSGYDHICSYTQSTCSEIAHDIGDPVLDSFITFARQFQETGLPKCDSDDFEDLNNGDSIGHGATMTVFKCFWKSRKRAVAVKKINLGVPLGNSMLEIHNGEYQSVLKSLFLELRVMNHPWFKAHPNFVDLLGVSWEHVEADDGISSYRPSLIVELADENTPTLDNFLSRQNGHWTDERQSLIFDLLTDIAEGVTMLHATKIVHGDLKPENILLFPASRRLIAKLSDFGFCSPFIESRDRIGGTCYWNAPVRNFSLSFTLARTSHLMKECMPDAPENIKPFARTLTRDLYSYGLIAWRSLFSEMPYGPDGSITDEEIQNWKLKKDLTSFLRANIFMRAPGLAGVCVTGEAASRIDESSGIMVIRPTKVAGMSEGLKTRAVGKVTCYRIGFGGQKDLRKAEELELDAAQAGSDFGQIKSLFYSLLDGIELPISKEEKVIWLKQAVSIIFFPGKHSPDTVVKQDRFRTGFNSIPTESVEVSLLHSLIKSYMTEWEVLNGDFDNAAEDPLFGLVVKGDLEGLRAALSSDRLLVLRRMSGFTILHVATDYCHEDIIRELIQKFNMSPNIQSDDGLTPIEMAANTGSIQCLHLLLSLGADSQPLGDQGLFTTVAMTGTRESPEYSPAGGNRTILSLLCGIVEDIHSSSSEDDPHVAVQALLNGRYLVDEEEIGNCGSPLELSISVLNYDSIFALLNLGANPNSFNYMPPLHIAVSLREPILTSLLLAYGADPNLRAGVAYDRCTALHHADTTSLTAFYEPPRNEVTSYEAYLAEGVEAVDTDNEDAVAARVRACIAVLLHFGADIHARDSKGETPLMRRVQEGDFETAEYLLQRGANLYAKDNQGLGIVEKVTSEDALRWCHEHGTTVKDKDGVNEHGECGGEG